MGGGECGRRDPGHGRPDPAGGEHLPTATHTTQTVVAHESGDLITADVLAGSTHRFPHLARPVDAVVRVEQHLDHRCQHDITRRTRRRRSGLGRVVRARSDLQHRADRLDTELVAVRVEELDDHRCGRSSSVAKKIEALRKISFARRNSFTSCSRRFTRSASADVTPAISPPSMSACFTHDRTGSTRSRAAPDPLHRPMRLPRLSADLAHQPDSLFLLLNRVPARLPVNP